MNINKNYGYLLGDLESIIDRRNFETNKENKTSSGEYIYDNRTRLLSYITPSETFDYQTNGLVGKYNIKAKDSITISALGKVEISNYELPSEYIQCARKLRIYPTESDKTKITKLFHISNAFYNAAIDGIVKKKIFSESSKKVIREECKVSNDVCETIHINAKDAYYDTRDLATLYAVANYKAMLTNKSNGNIKHFHLSNKHSMQVVHFSEKNARFKKGKLCIHDMKINLRRCDAEWLAEHRIKQQVIIKKSKSKYYLIVPFMRKNQDNGKKSICAIDPGNRTLATYYSPDEIGKLGDNILDLIKPIRNKIDHLKKLRNSDMVKSNTRYGMKQRIAKLNTKITNIIDYHQWKFANYLTKHFRLIFIPRLANCVSKQNGKFTRELRTKINRDTRSLCHSKFIDKLTHLGNVYGCKVVETKEYYTTMTCSNCGRVNRKVGGNKVFYCKGCKFTIDRDVNGAKNIWLRSLTN
ncbi:transposase ISSoc2 [Faustovirus]|nr:transposase ISSoc2 [Faustovirus]AMN84437.1 transposase ISSoc2 [Faustovirus]AMP44421.1 transposase [Faustovirus]